MPCRKLTCATCVAGALIMIVSVAKAADGAKYPDWEGAWERWYPANAVLDSGNGIYTAGGQPSFDQTKPWGRGQEAPLTPEYQKIFEDSIADQAKGGEGNFFDHAVRCMPGGIPLMTIAFTRGSCWSTLGEPSSNQVTTLESQPTHMIQEPSGQTLSEIPSIGKRLDGRFGSRAASESALASRPVYLR